MPTPACLATAEIGAPGQSARASEDTTPRRLALNAVTGGPGAERGHWRAAGPGTAGPMEHWAGYRRSDGTLGRFGSWAGPSSGPDVAGADESAGPVESVRPVGWRGCGGGGGGVGRCCGRDAEASREPVRALGSAGHRAAGVCRSALEASGPAWTASGDAAQVTTPLPQGPMAPADAAGAAALDASAGHAWDIAMATGQGSPLTPELALSLMPVAKSIVEPLRAYRVYAQALEAGADDAAVLLCYLGRRPDWKA